MNAQINESFEYDNCTVNISFTPFDKYGVDRHTITVFRPMCKSLKAQCFKKDIEEIRDFAKSMTCFVRTVCG